jgi:hypothetical protein
VANHVRPVGDEDKKLRRPEHAFEAVARALTNGIRIHVHEHRVANEPDSHDVTVGSAAAIMVRTVDRIKTGSEKTKGTTTRPAVPETLMVTIASDLYSLRTEAVLHGIVCNAAVKGEPASIIDWRKAVLIGLLSRRGDVNTGVWLLVTVRDRKG